MSLQIFNKKRIEILLISFMTLIGIIFICISLDGEKHINVNYNTHTFYMLSEYNSTLKTDINSLYIDGEVYFVLPHDMPKISTLTIIDESTFTEYEEKINIDRVESINDTKIHFVRSNLPFIYISLDHSITETPWFNLTNAETQKNDEYYGQMEIDSSGEIVLDSGIDYSYLKTKTNDKKTYDITLSRHGNGSWEMCSKKPLNLKLSDKESLLGLYNSKTYTLIANGKDKTLLRNYMANELAKSLNCDYVANMRFVTLYVDSMYCGVYLLSEKPKKVMEKNMSQNSDSFCVNWLSVDKDFVIPFSYYNDEFAGEADQSDGNGISAGLVLPKENQKEMSYYQAKIDQFMKEIGSGDFSHVDTENFVNYYWVQEVSKNFDAWYRSAYTIYDAEKDEWMQGTPWDFDMTWNYFDCTKTVQYTTPYELVGSYGIYSDMYENENIRNEIYNSYSAKVQPALKSLRSEMLSMYKYLHDDAVIDYATVNSDRTEMYADTNLIYGTSYDDAFDKYLEFFDERNRYLDEVFLSD